MSAVPAVDPALTLAIAFLNTYDLLESDPELMTAARLERWANHTAFTRLGPRLGTLSDGDIDRLRAVRSGLYPVFDAPDASTKIEHLNAALARQDVRPRMIAGDGGARLTVVGAGQADPVAELAAIVLDAITHAMAVGGPDRFGTCVGTPCRCVYVDRTRAARQRFCCQLCNDRVSAAAYRSRRAAAGT